MAVFRKFINSDVQNVIAAVRETYGELYTPKFMYDEDEICAAHLRGEIRLTVVLDEKGEFVGVIGLKTTEKLRGAVEVISFIIREKFRKLHIGTALLNACVNSGYSKSVPSVYASTAMLNSDAQSLFGKTGFKATGFWLNRKFLSDNLKDKKTYNNDKISMLVLVQNHSAAYAKELYLPKQYIKFAKDCYDGFGIETNFYQEYIYPLEAKTDYSQTGDEDFFNKNIYVYDAGKDFVGLLKEVSVLSSALSSISVFINIKKKTAVWAIEQLEILNYRFTGFLPLAGDYEYAIFHLCQCKVDYAEFTICSQFNIVKEKLGLK